MSSNDRFEQLARDAQRAQRPISRIRRALARRIPAALRRVDSSDQSDQVTSVLTDFARGREDVHFVQIGSCDGVTGDPLYELGEAGSWRGIVVEPLLHNFTKLVENYAHRPEVHCENVAIAAQNERRPFYYIAEDREGLPHWWNQIGSFDRDHLSKHSVLIPDIESMIVETELECITLPELFARCGIDRVDLIHTDVEGFDYEILRQIDFSKFRPSVVLFEDLHMGDADRANCHEMFAQQGYRFATNVKDTAAFL